MKVNFALLLNEELSMECTRFSKELSEKHPSKFILGGKSLAHISILQTHCDEAELDKLWYEASEVIDKKYELSLAGLNFLPSSSGDTWVEIQVLKNAAVLKLQQSLLALEVMKNRKIFNGVGDDFRPHITVGLLDNTWILDGIPLRIKLLRSKNVAAKLSLGHVGDNYIFTSSIFTYGI